MIMATGLATDYTVYFVQKFMTVSMPIGALAHAYMHTRLTRLCFKQQSQQLGLGAAAMAVHAKEG